MANPYLLAIDQGTTSTRAMIFTAQGNVVASAQLEFSQYFPKDGWVEHDPEEIWVSVQAVCRQVLKNANLSAGDIAGIGITNQRETTVVWDKHSGKAIYNAIVWQDRRTAEYCATLNSAETAHSIQHKTGLLLDAYFSATKIRWLLDHIEGAQEKAAKGELLFGTIDSYLIWKLTSGARHVTDASNASRTLLFNINSQVWDEDLLKLFDIPRAMLPEVLDCAADFGTTTADFLGAPVAIAGVAGDQQAALIGQACFQPGMVKSTYGTGCFMILNTGDKPVISQNRLLATVAYRLNGKVTYGLEGSIFMAGATVQWLRDSAKLIASASETGGYAEKVGYDHPVYLIPAFTGLGAPLWNPNARGAIVGLNRDTGIAEIVAAALQSVCYQTRDLLEAMAADGVENFTSVRVDGGMTANTWLLQCLADTLGIRVDKPVISETTALGAAMLAGLQLGLYASLDDIAQHWQLEISFEPLLAETAREKHYQGWQNALRTINSL